MALTIEAIHKSENDEALFDLLSAELQRLLPEHVQENREAYFQSLDLLPPGLRAMAGIHFLDVSMAMDDLTWHFGNQNDDRDLRETLNGLRELGMFEIAERFEQAWKIMEPHLDALRGETVSAENFYDWSESIGAQQQIEPMNDFIWDFCKKAGDLGLLGSWPAYARKHPERCVVAEVQS